MNLKRFLKAKTGSLFVQLFRYFISGSIAFSVDFFLLLLLTDLLHVYYLVSSVISFSVGLLITYFLSIKWIFDKRRIVNRRIEFILFSFIGSIGLLLTYLSMLFFTDILNMHYLISKILTTIIVFVWNFASKRFFLFTDKS